MSKIVAIHQPNFFPWLGYFDKVGRSDVFIFLDHVQLPKTGGMWTNRVKLLFAGEPRWVTAPLTRDFHGVRTIVESQFQSGNSWREKLMKSLVANYTHAPFYRETISFLEKLILNPEQNVSLYNSAAVTAISAQLGIPLDKFRWSSKLDVKGQSNEMLVSLTRAVGGDKYMCGGGAAGYQNDDLFSESGVDLLYQDFVHPTYSQIGRTEHAAGLSIVDALMNCGFSGVSKWVSKSSRAEAK
jgi:hypothetical protein